jgi:hypothetical protein
MLRTQLPRPLEESFGGHREELRRMSRPIGTDRALLAFAHPFAESLVLPRQHPRPGPIAGSASQDRRTIAGTILLIELMGKPVDHQGSLGLGGAAVVRRRGEPPSGRSGRERSDMIFHSYDLTGYYHWKNAHTDVFEAADTTMRCENAPKGSNSRQTSFVTQLTCERSLI